MTTTELRSWWGEYNRKFLDAENRTPSNAVSQKGIKNWLDGDCISYKMGDKKSDTQKIELPFLHKGESEVPVGGRAIDHTGPRGESSLQELTFTEITRTCSVDFSAVSNFFDFERQMNNQLLGTINSMNRTADDLIITQLLSYITQVNAASAATGVFNATSNFFEIAEANSASFFQFAKQMMKENEYEDMYDMILDPRLSIEFEKLINQGTSNSVNTQFQFNGINSMYAGQGFAGLYTGEALIMPEKSFAVAEHLPPAYLEAKGDSMDSNVGVFGVLPNPNVAGSQIGMHMYRGLVDTSATGGDPEDLRTQIQLVMYRGMSTKPLSVANESSIFAVGQMPTLI